MRSYLKILAQISAVLGVVLGHVEVEKFSRAIVFESNEEGSLAGYVDFLDFFKDNELPIFEYRNWVDAYLSLRYFFMVWRSSQASSEGSKANIIRSRWLTHSGGSL